MNKLQHEAQQLDEHWSPRVVGRINDQYVKVARVKGKLDWHEHDLEDEMLMILDGVLRMKYGGGEHVDLTAGGYAHRA